MRKKLIGLSLALLFFGSISAPTFAMTNTDANRIMIVDHNKDNDKDKTKAKAKKADKKECTTKSDCCTGEKAKCCDSKKDGDKK